MEHHGIATGAAPAPEAIDLPVEPEAHGEPESPAAKGQQVPSWGQFLKTASADEIKLRFANDVEKILGQNGMEKVCCLALLEPLDQIDNFDLDQIFTALTDINPAHDKDVVLFLLSKGGAGEPAYQISKLCKSFARSSFKAIVPRFAKSAATLIAIGADEIHMGPLGQLGPIDPQISGLPALGVSRALGTIASVAARYPRSAQMFATYLQMALTVEQIGYCDRISESAVQYAERLLSTKPSLASRAGTIATELVHEYKDHSFVIDFDEAQKHLGADWIKSGTPELSAAESIYSHFEMVNFLYSRASSKRLIVTGGAALPESLLILDKTD